MICYRQIIIFLVLLETYKIEAEEYLLICPEGFKPVGQGWYAKTPNNQAIDNYQTSLKDLTEKLAEEKSIYKPAIFSVCVICTNHDEQSLEVESCIGYKSLRKTSLGHSRKRSSHGDYHGTLTWSKAINPIGLKIDMTKGDLLSTLKNIQVVTNSTLRSFYLNCPDGFQLERVEARRSFDSQSRIRECFICTRDQNEFSSCVSQEKHHFELSLLLPTLAVSGENCRGPFNYAFESCYLLIKKLLKGNQSPCGINLIPSDFLTKNKTFIIDYLNFDCLNREFQGE